MIRTVCDLDSKEVIYPWVIIEYRVPRAEPGSRARRLDFCDELCAGEYFTKIGHGWKEVDRHHDEDDEDMV